MNFKIKCILQSIFSIMPGSEDLNYFAQKKISKSLPPDKESFGQIRGAALLHHGVFDNCGMGFDSTVYELGCGWHLGMALVLSRLGYRNIIALDTVRHLRSELVRSILEHISADAGGLFSLKDVTPIPDAPDELTALLKKEFGINYLAPCDSAATGLNSSSVDCIYSHAVFEHIPPDVLPDILAECHRVLKFGGVASIVIDYADHYRTFDKSITPYNFLQYSDKAWKKYNPSLHYVNRLRHRDFVNLFKEAGFEFVSVTEYRPDGFEDMIKDFSFAAEFKEHYSLDDLSITHADFVLKKI